MRKMIEKFKEFYTGLDNVAVVVLGMVIGYGALELIKMIIERIV